MRVLRIPSPPLRCNVFMTKSLFTLVSDLTPNIRNTLGHILSLNTHNTLVLDYQRPTTSLFLLKGYYTKKKKTESTLIFYSQSSSSSFSRGSSLLSYLVLNPNLLEYTPWLLSHRIDSTPLSTPLSTSNLTSSSDSHLTSLDHLVTFLTP